MSVFEQVCAHFL